MAKARACSGIILDLTKRSPTCVVGAGKNKQRIEAKRNHTSNLRICSANCSVAVVSCWDSIGIVSGVVDVASWTIFTIPKSDVLVVDFVDWNSVNNENSFNEHVH